jgi:predicted nucleic-acid-binding Zn-ribbon protein
MGMKKHGVCPDCGAKEIITGVNVEDKHNSFALREVELYVDQKPDAVLFKERIRSALNACVCGRCGHVELHVADPSALWDAYQAARNRGG